MASRILSFLDRTLTRAVLALFIATPFLIFLAPTGPSA